MWLADTPAAALREAFEALKRAIEDPLLGGAKGSALRELLEKFRREGVTEIGVVARSVSNRLVVSRWMEKQGLTYPVLLPSNASDNGFFERLICTAWPNSGQFGHLLRQHAAPLIYLIAYPFECRWLELFKRQQRSISLVPSLKSSEKSELVGLSDDSKWPEEQLAPPSPDAPVGDRPPTYDFDEGLPGRHDSCSGTGRG